MSIPDPELYQELRELAKRFMSNERSDHTLSPTDLFHEAYTRLFPLLSATSGQSGTSDKSCERACESASLRSLFAITMRRVLIDHARRRARRTRRLARVGWADSVSDSEADKSREEVKAMKLLELDEALTRFALNYPVHARLVELKFFGGMTVTECAEEIGVCGATVQRYWNFSRAWIARELDRIELE